LSKHDRGFILSIRVITGRHCLNIMNENMKKILCVDDEELIRQVVGDYLEDMGYKVERAANGKEALRIFHEWKPDLILLDLRMPEMDGKEVLAEIHKVSGEIPVIVISGTGYIKDVIETLHLGAWDYITKPVEDMAIIDYAVQKALDRLGMIKENRRYKQDLEDLVGRRTTELKVANTRLVNILQEIVHSLSIATEKRDPYTAGHQERVSLLAAAIATEMGLEREQIGAIRIAGLLHDVGKIYVPQEFLSKPTRFEPHEMEVVKKHSEVGYEIMKNISFPWPIAEIALQHHERLDGSGYPRGLNGDDILIESKIIATADVVEAMSSHRPYRPAMGIEVALAEIVNNRGLKFQPESVDACIKVLKRLDGKIDAIKDFYEDFLRTM